MDNLTIISIISASFTFIIILIKTAYKSKCSKIKCCCIEISRDVNKEIEETKYNIDHNIKDDDIENLKQSIK
jgi:recombinational DNA repair protein RecT